MKFHKKSGKNNVKKRGGKKGKSSSSSMKKHQPFVGRESDRRKQLPKETKTKFAEGKPSTAMKKHQPLIERESDRKWYDTQFDEVRPENSAMADDDIAQKAHKRAEELLSREIAHFSQSYRSQNRADADWLEMVATRGTFPDRLSALQLRVQRSAVHALPQLRQFVTIAQRKGAAVRQAHTLNKALKELFLDELLPPKRKLLKLSQRPLEKWVDSTKPEADKRLLFWHFEAQLKELYHQFVEGLQALAGNTAEGVALGACQEMAELLAERPEQEQQLLAALVNKMGHPTHRVGAGVAQYLERTVAQRHPMMRSVLIKEVETMLFRKNISPKAQRYGLHFLSRIILDAGEIELALQLIHIYLKLFHILVKRDALAEYPKLLPLLVSGLNRAFPYAKGRTAEVLDNVHSLYTIVQTAKFSTALSVLRLLFQIHSASDGLSDRFYAAFYRRLFNLQPGNQQHDTQLFALAQQILRNDLVECRVRAFLKRLFQIALSANSAFAAAILLLCHSVVRERPQLLRVEWTTADSGETQQKIDRYNPTARNPLFAGAEWTLDYELATLAHHFHPTVASFSQSLINGKPIPYRGDPLIDLSQMRFLDRFAFKNPKKRKLLVPPSAGTDGTDASSAAASVGPPPSLFAHSYTPSGVKALNPTSQDYLSKRSSEIPLDERFLHHFATLKFQKEPQPPPTKKRRDDEDDDEVASLDSDEFDTLLERFEPGESREIFDVDFGSEFGKESTATTTKKSRKRKRPATTTSDSENEEEDDDDDDEGDEAEEEDEVDDGFGEDEIDNDDDEDDEDLEDESDGGDFDDDGDDGTDGDEEELEFE